MKVLFNSFLLLASALLFIMGCGKTVGNKLDAQYPASFKISVVNNADLPLNDKTISVSIESILQKHPDFNPKAFVVMTGGEEIPSQTESISYDHSPSNIIFISDFAPKSERDFTVRFNKTGASNNEYTKRTQAVLSVKEDYKLVDGFYTGGKFVDTDFVKVPEMHKIHDALFRVEGPAWESDKIAYRFYLDSRNRNDIFGKKVDSLEMQNVGRHDLVSNSRESYTTMLDWGMDIYKVGESLGIGSFGTYINNKVVTVWGNDSVLCGITTNGPIKSDVLTKYYGWNAGKSTYNLTSDLSITAGSRLTKVNLTVSGDINNFCTGLANHPTTNFIESGKNAEGGWGYIGLYGGQSLAGDSLGTAVFYKKSDLIKMTKDSDSYILILKPTNGTLTYYFAAAWEQEPGGIKTQSEFEKYLNETCSGLSDELTIKF